MNTADLERRYRRLLAVYPWEHRRRYEDEMLAVLLDGARPGQRRPGMGDVVNLALAGLRVRLGLTARSVAEPAWADGAAVTGLLAALVLLALAGHALTDAVGPSDPLQGPIATRPLDTLDWLRAAGWAAVCLAVIAGLRRWAAGLAWTAVLAQFVLLTPRYEVDPVPVVTHLWQAVLSLVAAVALSVPAQRRRAVAVLGARRLLTIVGALALVDGIFLTSRIVGATTTTGESMSYQVLHLAWGEPYDPTYDLVSPSGTVMTLYELGLVAAALALLVAVATITPPARRRVVVLTAPVLALAVLVGTTLDGWAISNQHFASPIHLVSPQWAALVGVPLLTLLVGLLWLRRREQTLRLAELGRAADRSTHL